MKDYSLYKQRLSTLISIKSVLDKPTVSAPFGTPIKDALDFYLSTAKEFGFATVDYDGYAGEVVFGDGVEQVGIIGHLDVVPAGNGWQTDPFSLTLKEGVFYGRGVQDDKAPMLSILFALKELKEQGFVPSKKIRVFVGCDEETGWRDVERLLKSTTLPEYGFSPDGDFPVSYAEKGVTVLTAKIPKLKNFYSIKGGTVVNAVCDYAFCYATPSGIDLDLIKKHGLNLDGFKIESRGISAHGSSPHLGKNAILPLLNYFLDMGEDVGGLIDYLFNDKLGLTKMQNEQGYLTLSPDLIYETDNQLTIECDARIPAPLQNADLLPIVKKFPFTAVAQEKHPAVMVDKGGPFVNALTDAYGAITGQNCQPLSLGGSTFSRAFKRGVAFGPKFPNTVDNIHNANECVLEKDLLTAFRIYKKAIENLCK